MRVLDAVAAADEPVRVDPRAIRWEGEGQDRRAVVDNVEHWLWKAALSGQTFAELGIVGGVMFLWLTVAGLAAGWRSAASARRDPTAVALFAGVLGYLTTCATGHPILVAETAFAKDAGDFQSKDIPIHVSLVLRHTGDI